MPKLRHGEQKQTDQRAEQDERQAEQRKQEQPQARIERLRNENLARLSAVASAAERMAEDARARETGYQLTADKDTQQAYGASADPANKTLRQTDEQRAVAELSEAQKSMQAQLSALDRQEQVAREYTDLAKAVQERQQRDFAHLAGGLAIQAQEAEQQARERGVSAAEVAARQNDRDEQIAAQLARFAERQLAETKAVQKGFEDSQKLVKGLVDDVAAVADAEANKASQDKQSAATAGQDQAATLQAAKQLFDKHDDQQLLIRSKLAWEGRFSEHPALHAVWDDAVKAARQNDAVAVAERGQRKKDDLELYKDARSEFGKLVNSAEGENAKQVRAMLELAGVQFREDSNAMLMEAGPERRAEPGKALNREQDKRLVTIDHAIDKGKNPQYALDASNLRFSPKYDNSMKGASYDVSDGWKLNFHHDEDKQEQNRKEREAAARRRATEGWEDFVSLALERSSQRLDQARAEGASRSADELKALNTTHEQKQREFKDLSSKRLDQDQSASQRDSLEANQREETRRVNDVLEARMNLLSRQREQIEALAEAMETIDRPEVTAAQANADFRSLEQRHDKQREDFESLADRLDERRYEDTKRFMEALYARQTVSMAQQEEEIKKALDAQREARLKDLKQLQDFLDMTQE